MKKIVLSILGIFALVACSEDVYQDIDKQNNGLEAANTASNDGSGANAPFTVVPDYESFWDINTRGTQEMFYTYRNRTGDISNPARLHFRVTPYVGLAYYDGYNDGIYYGTSLDVTNYPNLYDGIDEIGKFLPSQPFMLDGTGLGGGTVFLEIISLNHCHTLSAILNSDNPNQEYFNLSAIPATTQEEDLLADYGKVFFYFWEAVDPLTNATVWSGFVMPQCDTNDATHWGNTGISVNVPGGGSSVDLYVNINSLGSPDPSEEIVLPVNTYPHSTPFSYAIGAWVNDYKVEVTTYSTGRPISLLSLSFN